MSLPRGYTPLRGVVDQTASVPSHTPVASAGPAIGRPRTYFRRHLHYYGGPVISNVKVYLVAWGDTVDATNLGRLASFYADVTNSTYFDWLSEYDTAGRDGEDGRPGSGQTIGRGSFGGIFTIAPSNGAARLSSAEVAAELSAQIQAGHLPAPEVDRLGNVNGYYAVQFPASVTIVLEPGGLVSCQDFCAYHGTISMGSSPVPFGVLPALAGGCAYGRQDPRGFCGFGGDSFDNVTFIQSHELIEAVTDPAVGLAVGNARPLAWQDPHYGEVADICDVTDPDPRVVGGWVVEGGWSNTFSRCQAVAPP